MTGITARRQKSSHRRIEDAVLVGPRGDSHPNHHVMKDIDEDGSSGSPSLSRRFKSAAALQNSLVQGTLPMAATK
jgi:hypothetical protein